MGGGAGRGFQISMEQGWKKIKNEQAGNTSILYSIVAISQKMVLLTRKQKCTKKCVIKQEIKFSLYRVQMMIKEYKLLIES